MNFIAKITKKRSTVVRLSCAALSFMLVICAAPFLTGYAEGEEVTCTTDENGVVTITGNNPNTALHQSDIVNTVAWSASQLIIGDSITTITDGAFEGNHSIQKITVSSDVKNVYKNAFLYCYGLNEITFDCQDTYFHDNVFSGCNALTKVNLLGTKVRMDSPLTLFNGGNEGVTLYVDCHVKYFDDYITPVNPDFRYVIVDTYSINTVNKKDATCTEEGNTGDKICTRCGTTIEEGQKIDKLDHTWGDWTTTLEPTESVPGKKERECSGCHTKEEEEIPATGTSSDDSSSDDSSGDDDPAVGDKYEFTSEGVFKWTKGSKTGMTVIVKNTTGDDTKTIVKFDQSGKVFSDGTELENPSQYTTKDGSVKITLLPDYLKNLKNGEHKLKVVIDGQELEHTYTIAESGGTNSPDTGDSIVLTVYAFILMTLAACGAVFVFTRRKIEIR